MSPPLNRLQSLITALVIATLFYCSRSFAQPSDLPVKWNPIAFDAPKVHDAEGFQAPGVRGIFYDALPFDGKPTRVFAWLGLPKIEPGKK
jgi:hypothetical protein